MWYAISLLLLLLAGCEGREEWKGYALRDTATRHDTRLVGGYGSADTCRTALLAEPSDPSSESLVCVNKCEEVGTELTSCAKSILVRVADPEKGGPAPQPTP